MKAPQLRPYQSQAVKALLRLFRNHRRVVAVAPTGSGKTTTAVGLLKRWPQKRVLWLAHRIELLRQAHDELLRAGVPEAELGMLSGADKANESARILVASIDMFRSRPVPNVDVIVVDEAHRIMANSYRRLLRRRPKAIVLGLTATPRRLDGKPLGDVFQELLVIAESVELIADGHIAKAVCYGLPKEKARDMLKGVAAGKDYAVGELGKAMSKRTLMGDIVKECARLAPGERTLVFAVNREHGKALLRRFLKAGRRAEYLDAETPAEERASMVGKGGRLARGETEVVVNVDVLSEGFDCPPVKCIALARPTKSLTRFLQQIGRASRPYRGKRPVVIDHAGNCWRFGLPETPREWSLDGREQAASEGDAPERVCPSCSYYIPAGCKACPECGAELPATKAALAEHDARLARLAATEVELERKLTVLRKLALLRGLDESWVSQKMQEVA